MQGELETTIARHAGALLVGSQASHAGADAGFREAGSDWPAGAASLASPGQGGPAVVRGWRGGHASPEGCGYGVRVGV